MGRSVAPEMEGTMVTTAKECMTDDTDRMIESVRDAEALALESVRKFVETVNSIVVDVRDDRLRRKIIDAGVEMTHHFVDASSEFAQKIVAAASDAWAAPESSPEPSE